MTLSTPLRRTDALLWVAVMVLVPLGLLMVSSASAAEGAGRLTPEVRRQGLYAAAGLIAMLIAARIDYRWLQTAARPLFIATLVLLGAVIAVGIAQHGAQRWLAVGEFTVQPSEFAKLGLAIALAAYAAERRPRAPAVLTSAGSLGATAALVLLQPDLGTVVVLCGAWLVFLVAWGTPWRTIAALLGSGAALVPLALAVAVPDYQRERIAVFVDPSRDPLGSGFNLRQVELALGSAGLSGHGLYSGAESHLDSVAARSSDFMFGFLGAELGLVGGAVLLATFAILVVRGFAVAAEAPDAFGRLLAATLTAVVLVQATVNIAVNLRLFPATGIPLPFISQGGSSLIVMLIAVGVIQSVASRSRPHRR